MAFDRLKTLVVWVWNPITRSHSSTLDSTQQKYHECKIMLGPSSQKTCELGKFIIMGKATFGWPTLFTMARNG
jgi:hypothetical protein